MGPRAGVEATARQMVPGGQAQRLGQLSRPTRARRQERPRGADLGGRAAWSRAAHHVRRAACRRQQRSGCAPRRPRRDLPAHGPRSRGRDARVRAHRRGAHGGVRRLLRRVAAGPDQRRRRENPDHRGRRVSPRRDRAVEAERGRRDRRHARHRARHRAAAHGPDRDVQDRPRPLVVGADGACATRLPARSDGCGGPAVHPLHLRHDRQAERDSAHHRRVPDAGVCDDEMGL